MFLGEYNLKFTGQGRVILPKKLRLGLSGGIVLSRGFENCVWGFSKDDFEKEARRQLELLITEERARNLRRFIFSGSVEVDLDEQGRFVIPMGLLGHASLNRKSEVVIVGAGDHFEVWEKGRWRKQLKEMEKEYGS